MILNMNNTELKQLCVSLAKADTEKEVISILKQIGYWDNPRSWRYYGDNENNFATIGNQQSRPDSALVEKIINSVDAMLMRECLRRGISPTSNKAPKSIEAALKDFFDIFKGKLSNLDSRLRTNLAKNIALVATGTRSNPSYSIIDKGEGQTPKKMPDTFLSLNKSNKLRIPFVQGKFNMGGTGALQFCGHHNIQLIISKRDPKIANNEKDPTKDYWGFTIIRREDPSEGMKNSTFKYLAPDGNILMFEAENLPLLPKDYPEAYGNQLEWGTFIKLYDYQLIGLKSPVYFDLYYRLSLLLPNIALPITLYERRRGYRAQSYHIILSGLSVRLDEDTKDNLEPGFPSASEITVMGQKMKILIYVFKKGQKRHYAGTEGIIFTINGQAHGFFDKSFFERKAVGMSYLSDSILVLVDCSEFDGRTREDLFMNSRDRLREGELRSKIERHLESLLKNHQGLRELRERRRREEIEDRLQDSKPLAEVIEDIIKKSPTLSKLLIDGIKIQNPFKFVEVIEGQQFQGKKFPTYFKLKTPYTERAPKHCPLNRRFRVQFETDAENDYFSRDTDPGKFSLQINGKLIGDYSLNLWNGIANLTAKLLPDAKVGDLILVKSEVTDISRIEPFSNNFWIIIDKPEAKQKGETGKRTKPPGEKPGKKRELPSSLGLPQIIRVRRDDWDKYGFDKDGTGALLVKDAGENRYDFYINIDNIYLQNEIKTNTKTDYRLLEARFEYGMVLIGLSLLHYFENKENRSQKSNNGETVYHKIYTFTKAVSPFLLPMIASLGELEI